MHMAEDPDMPEQPEEGASKRPKLHLVTDDRGDQADPAPSVDPAAPADSAEPAESASTSPARSASTSHDRLVEARAVLAAADPESTYKSLLQLSRPAHSDVLQSLPYTRSLEFHDPTCVRVDPTPSGVETVELYARAAFPDFDTVLLDSFNSPLNDHLLNNLRHLLFNEGENVALVTNHGQIIDIGLVIGAVLSAMCSSDRTFGVLGTHVAMEDLAERINILVSRMVVTRQAFGVPAMQVLQTGARSFLSIPQTASRRRARLDPAMVKANNVVMRHELDYQLSKGGQLLAMAASGSQDLSLAAGLVKKARSAWMKRRSEEPPEETRTLHLQPLYDGTITLMLSCRYVMPVAISMDPTAPACVLGQLTRLREKDDCHRVMDWIAEAHQEATGVPTIYHWHEDDLLTQVRGLADSLRR
jgi:hypothetical protein